MSIPFAWYIDPFDREEFEARLHRDIADQLTEAIDNTNRILADGLCRDLAFDVDANGELLIRADVEKIINNALSSVRNLCDALARRGCRK